MGLPPAPFQPLSHARRVSWHQRSCVESWLRHPTLQEAHKPPYQTDPHHWRLPSSTVKWGFSCWCCWKFSFSSKLLACEWTILNAKRDAEFYHLLATSAGKCHGSWWGLHRLLPTPYFLIYNLYKRLNIHAHIHIHTAFRDVFSSHWCLNCPLDRGSAFFQTDMQFFAFQ